jgi:hypothetical protein
MEMCLKLNKMRCCVLIRTLLLYGCTCWPPFAWVVLLFNLSLLRISDSTVAGTCQQSWVSFLITSQFAHWFGVIGTICLQKPVRNQMLIDFVLLNQPLKKQTSFSWLFLNLQAGILWYSGKKTHKPLVALVSTGQIWLWLWLWME